MVLAGSPPVSWLCELGEGDPGERHMYLSRMGLSQLGAREAGTHGNMFGTIRTGSRTNPILPAAWFSTAHLKLLVKSGV